MRSRKYEALPLLAFFLLLAVGGLVSRRAHQARLESALYEWKFRVPSISVAGQPIRGSRLPYETFTVGDFTVLEVGDVRVALRGVDGRSRFSGSVDYRNPRSPSGTPERDTISLGARELPIINGEIHVGGRAFPLLGERRLIKLDGAGRILEEKLLEKP